MVESNMTRNEVQLALAALLPSLRERCEWCKGSGYEPPGAIDRGTCGPCRGHTWVAKDWHVEDLLAVARTLDFNLAYDMGLTAVAEAIDGAIPALEGTERAMLRLETKRREKLQDGS